MYFCMCAKLSVDATDSPQSQVPHVSVVPGVCSFVGASVVLSVLRLCVCAAMRSVPLRAWRAR